MMSYEEIALQLSLINRKISLLSVEDLESNYEKSITIEISNIKVQIPFDAQAYHTIFEAIKKILKENDLEVDLDGTID